MSTTTDILSVIGDRIKSIKFEGNSMHIELERGNTISIYGGRDGFDASIDNKYGNTNIVSGTM